MNCFEEKKKFTDELQSAQAITKEVGRYVLNHFIKEIFNFFKCFFSQLSSDGWESYFVDFGYFLNHNVVSMWAFSIY